MWDFLLTYLPILNMYIKYLYYAIGIAFIVVLLFMILPELGKLLKHLQYIAQGGENITLKLETINNSTANIKNTLDKNMPILATFVGIISVLKILKRAFKKTKGKKHRISAMLNEYNKEANKRNFMNNTMTAVRTITPIIQAVRK